MVTNWAKGRVVVGYVRSSYEGDDAQRFSSSQNRKIEQFVAEAGMQVVASHVERGSGSGGMKQPALQRLLAAAQSGERAFDVVLVYSLSRLCRRSEALHVLLSLLRDSGVEVVSVSEPHTLSA